VRRYGEEKASISGESSNKGKRGEAIKKKQSDEIHGKSRSGKKRDRVTQRSTWKYKKGGPKLCSLQLKNPSRGGETSRRDDQ